MNVNSLLSCNIRLQPSKDICIFNFMHINNILKVYFKKTYPYLLIIRDLFLSFLDIIVTLKFYHIGGQTLA